MSPVNWAKVEHFDPDEFVQPDKMEEGLIYRLDAVRTAATKLAGEDVPVHITSGYRPGDGEHGEGEAVDISDNDGGFELASRWRFYVLQAAFLVGFRRIGVYDRHIHLGTSREEDQDVCWWGKSQ